jgi:hypothetical protein
MVVAVAVVACGDKPWREPTMIVVSGLLEFINSHLVVLGDLYGDEDLMTFLMK